MKVLNARWGERVSSALPTPIGKLPLVLLLVAVPAFASGKGELVFQKACSACHTVTPPKANGKSQPPPQTRGAGPDLATVVKGKTSEALRTWIAAPHRLNPKTGCDTRAALGDVDELLEYLYVMSRPLPPPDAARREAALEAEVKERRQAPAGNANGSGRK